MGRDLPEKNQLVKLVVELPEDDQAAAELLWGMALVDNTYQLRSVPIWAYGLAYEDILEANREADGRLHVSSVRQRSGLLTVRIAGPDAPPAAFANLRQEFASRAIAAEHFSETYSAFAVAKPDFEQLLPIVEFAEQTGVIFVEISSDHSFGGPEQTVDARSS